MAIKKPLEKKQSKKVDIDAIISKGAPVIADTKTHDENRFVNLRIPNSMLMQIDQFVEKRIGLTRMAWLLEALQEKLERDNQ